MTQDLAITTKSAEKTVLHYMPNRTIQDIEDRGMWMRHIFKVTLDGGEIVYLKLGCDPEKEAFVCELLHNNNLSAPYTIAVDTTCEILPEPFIIQTHVGGAKLGTLLEQADEADTLDIHRALGRFYRRLHAIHHTHSAWIYGAGKMPPYAPDQTPNDFMHENVVEKIGAEAVDRGSLPSPIHERTKQLLTDNLVFLKDHTPTMISGGAQHWTVYLAKNSDWHVTKIMDLSDLLYWDPAWDLVTLKYPLFRAPPSPAHWEALLSEYGPAPDEKRLKLYLLIRYLDAGMGNYAEPQTPAHEYRKAMMWKTFEQVLNEAAQL